MYVIGVATSPLLCFRRDLQDFCQEVVLWKHLEHPNIVPLMGATVDPFQALFVWMTGGDLSEYISAHPCADRLSLVCSRRSYVETCLLRARYPMSLTVSVTSTLTV